MSDQGQVVPSSSRGPIGKQRTPLGVLGLMIITLGIYTLYWEYMVYEENKVYSGEGVGGLVGMLIGLICGIVTPFLLAGEVEKIYVKDGRPAPVSATTGFWIFLPFVGYLIWLWKVQDAINELWLSGGAAAV